MYKRILIALDGSEYFLTAIEYGVYLAQGKSCHILGFAPVNEKSLLGTKKQGNQLQIKVPPHVAAQVKRSISEFQLYMTEHKIAKEQYEIKQAVGDPFYMILREATFCDILVIGEECHFPDQTQPDDSADRLLYRSSRPILFTPAKFRPVQTVIMGIDGTASASRLIYMYTHLNPFPQAKIFLVHTKWEKDTFQLDEYFQNAETYFKKYGFNVQSVELDKPFPEALLEVAQEQQGNLISFGIREELYKEKVKFDQSLVRPILDASKCPVLTLR